MAKGLLGEGKRSAWVQGEGCVCVRVCVCVVVVVVDKQAP